MTKEEIQSAISLLIGIHESPEKLEEMAEANGFGVTSCVCKNSLITTVRYLMKLRDAEDAKAGVSA